MKCTLVKHVVQRRPKFAGLSNLDPNIAKQRTSISTSTPWTLWTAISPKWNVCPMVVWAWLLCLACFWGSHVSGMLWCSIPVICGFLLLLAPNPLQGIRTIWSMWPSCFIQAPLGSLLSSTPVASLGFILLFLAYRPTPCSPLGAWLFPASSSALAPALTPLLSLSPCWNPASLHRMKQHFLSWTAHLSYLAYSKLLGPEIEFLVYWVFKETTS